MKIHFVCGYYSDLAHELRKRTEPYWDAYFYVWAVKVGKFHRKFLAHKRSGKVVITEVNFELVRRWFGDFISHTIRIENLPSDSLLVPIPSKDGIVGVEDYRALNMLKEALRDNDFEENISDTIRWSEKIQPAHAGGDRSRQYLLERIVVGDDLKEKNVILVDDILSTGSSMLAARDACEAMGATVVCGIVCGKTIYDFETKPFGLQSIELDKELSDYKAE